MMSKRLPATIAATSMLVLALGACGSSSSKGLNLPGATNKSGGSDNSKSSGNGSFADLIGKAKTADIKISYKTSKNGDEFTLIQRGNDTVYISGDTSVYSVGGKSTTCQGTGSDAKCTSLPSTGSLGKGLGTGLLSSYSTLLSTLATSPLVKDVKTSKETIAGRSAQCVTLTGALAATGQSGTVCVDASTGILLSVKDDSGSLFEATSVGEPSDSDFKLPATPQTIPSYTIPTTP
jgi:hypothetical protein